MASETPKNPTGPAESGPATQIAYLRALTQIVREEELSELEIENAGVRITLKAPEAAPVVVPTPGYPATAQPLASITAAHPADVSPGAGSASGETSPDSSPETELIEIVSPMVGVFYRAPSPSDPNFVEVGDRVEAGQTVALIEAMKVFNEIVAESAGTVIDIKAQNSELVETGGILMTLCPHQADS